jgi:hypothetical protein
LYFNQSQGTLNGQVFVTDFELGKFYVLTIGWNPSSNEVVAKVNNASLTVLGNTFVAGSGESDITAEFFKLFPNTTENYRIAFGAGGDLMDNTRATAIYNQIVTDHQKPFVFPTADSLVNTQAACVLDLDATLYNSFPDLDSQHWIDTVSGAKFYLGTDTAIGSDDPEFIGDIGDAGSIFDFDGDAYFKALDANTVLAGFHKTAAGTKGTLLFNIVIGDLVGISPLCGTATTNSHHGFYIYVDTDGSVVLGQANGSATANLVILPAASIVAGQSHVLAVGREEDTGLISVSLDGAAFTTTAESFNATTTGATYYIKLMANATTSAKARAGSKIKSFSVYNKLLSDLELTAELAKLEARHT